MVKIPAVVGFHVLGSGLGVSGGVDVCIVAILITSFLNYFDKGYTNSKLLSIII